MPSLYALYVREREGFEIIEVPEGFITYKIDAGTCYIRDLYVLPDHRKSGVASALADEVTLVARRAGCTSLLGTVDCRTIGHAASMRVLLAYGFDVAESHEGYVILKKALSPTTEVP